MDYKYKVIVRCQTYNHASYIVDTLNGFCMQQTSFPFVCAIVDDCSTDGEQKIIESYLQNNFDFEDGGIARNEKDGSYQFYFARHKLNKNCYFAVFFLAFNHYSIKKTKQPYFKEWQSKSQYIAVCEGDDYWTDPSKLQKQADFLDSHPDFSICSHDFIKYNQLTNSFYNHSFFFSLFTRKNNEQIEYIEYTLDTFFDRWWTQPLTYMYRNGSYLDLIPSYKYRYYRDTVFAYYVLKEGKGALLNFLGGVYRLHDNGIYAGKDIAYNWKIGVKNGYDIYSIEKDERALKHCLRYEHHRVYNLINSKRYKELAIDLFSFAKLMPVRVSFQLLKLLFFDKVNYWKSLL